MYLPKEESVLLNWHSRSSALFIEVCVSLQVREQLLPPTLRTVPIHRMSGRMCPYYKWKELMLHYK